MLQSIERNSKKFFRVQGYSSFLKQILFLHIWMKPDFLPCLACLIGNQNHSWSYQYIEEYLVNNLYFIM